MTKKSDYIYAFVHIPKTAGYTLRYHLLKNFKKEQILLMSFKNLKLNGYNPPKSEKVFKDAAKKYISSLSKNCLRKTRIIVGHLVHSGLEKYFDREIRYVTFIRKLDDWLFSVYRHWVRSCKVSYDREDRKKHFRKVLLVNGKIPDYSSWLIKRRDTPFLKDYSTINGFLNRRGFSSDFKNKSEVLSLIKQFYFVGLTKNYTEESLFIYDRIGVKKFFFDQNMSHNNSNIESEDRKKGIDFVDEKDRNIYNAAVQLNTDFKKNHPTYNELIKRKRIQKMLLLPFTQPLFAPRKTLIRVSERLKYDKPFFK